MLIDKTEISKHREVSRSVRDDKINPYIEDAEYLDLKPLLGSELYFDLIKNKLDPKYIDLLQPKEGEHQGLSKVISLFAYGRYILFGSFTDTAFGFVQKSNQDSQPVGNEFKRNIHKQDQQAAISYFNEIAIYLDKNKDTYPLWRISCNVSELGRFRISKIS